MGHVRYVTHSVTRPARAMMHGERRCAEELTRGKAYAFHNGRLWRLLTKLKQGTESEA
jgi:hypothetical protein